MEKVILCIGMANVDVMAYNVDSLNDDGDTTFSNDIEMTTGGDAFNTALRLSSMGLRTGFSGIIGNDTAGKFLLAKMEGISTDGVAFTDSEKTAICMCLVDRNGQRKFIYNPGANKLLSGSNLTDEIISNASVLHAGGVMQMAELEKNLPDIFGRARRLGVITTMDVTYDSDCLWLKKIEDTLHYTDYFLPSIEEASKISGSDDVREIRDFFSNYGMKGLVVKLGKRGCYVTDFINESFYEMYPLEAVDTTGAGDSFVAGFLSAISKGFNCFEGAKIGNVVGAVCVTGKGASGGKVTFDEAQKMAEKYYKW